MCMLHICTYIYIFTYTDTHAFLCTQTHIHIQSACSSSYMYVLMYISMHPVYTSISTYKHTLHLQTNPGTIVEGGEETDSSDFVVLRERGGGDDPHDLPLKWLSLGTLEQLMRYENSDIDSENSKVHGPRHLWRSVMRLPPHAISRDGARRIWQVCACVCVCVYTSTFLRVSGSGSACPCLKGSCPCLVVSTHTYTRTHLPYSASPIALRFRVHVLSFLRVCVCVCVSCLCLCLCLCL